MEIKDGLWIKTTEASEQWQNLILERFREWFKDSTILSVYDKEVKKYKFLNQKDFTLWNMFVKAYNALESDMKHSRKEPAIVFSFALIDRYAEFFDDKDGDEGRFFREYFNAVIGEPARKKS